MPISENFLHELKSKLNIGQVISDYVCLKQKGSNFIGLCPFHNEKTPSFTVYNDTQSFYCFGCGTGGDVITFIRKIENLNYTDAVKLLAQRAGIEMSDEKYSDRFFRKKQRILEINRESAQFFYDYIMSSQGKNKLDYLFAKGLNMKIIKQFKLGFAPDSYDMLLKHLKSKGYKVWEIVEAGVVKISKNNHYYDTFRNRIIIPIIDIRGNIISFSGKSIINEDPVYLNTADTCVYTKNNELFALNFAKGSQKKSFILCDGFIDAIYLHQSGYDNAIACCNSRLTQEQVNYINRYTEEIYIAFDNDSYGRRETLRAIDMFRKTDLKIKIPIIEKNKDIIEIIRTGDKNKLKEIFSILMNDIEFKLSKLKSKYNLYSIPEKTQFINEAVKILSLTSPIEQDLYLTELSKELSIDKGMLNLQLQNLTPVSH